jgi:hypothetical protein
MILVTEKNTIEVQENQILVDGEVLVKGILSIFFTDQESDSTFHIDAGRTEPQIGDRLIIFDKGEEHPVYQSLPITEIK